MESRRNSTGSGGSTNRCGRRVLFSFASRRREEAEFVTGLSIRREGIAVARIRREPTSDTPHLVLCEFVPSAGSGDRDELLRQLAERHGLAQFGCVSLLDDDDTALLLVEAPQVAPAELPSAIRWRIKDLVDFRLDEAVIEVFEIGGEQRGGPARMVYAVAARNEAVRRHIDLVEGAGVRLDVIEIHALAQNNVAALLPENPQGVALLHFSRYGGMLTISRGGDLVLARNLNFGTESLVTRLAEVERVLDGANGETAAVEMVNAMFITVVEELERSFEYYEGHFGLPPVAAVVLASNEHHIPGLLCHLAGNISSPVRMLDLNTVLTSDVPLSEELQGNCLPAIGAAMRKPQRAA